MAKIQWVRRLPALAGHGWLVGFLLTTSVVRVSAQEAAPAPVGTPMRLEVGEERKRVEGALAGWSENGVRVELPDDKGTITVPTTDIVLMETMVRPSQRGRGALIGGAILGGVSLAYAGFWCREGGCDAGSVAVFVGVFGALGAGIGAAVAPGAEWQHVLVRPPPAPDGPRLSIGPAPGGGVAGSLSIGW